DQAADRGDHVRLRSRETARAVGEARRRCRGDPRRRRHRGRGEGEEGPRRGRAQRHPRRGRGRDRAGRRRRAGAPQKGGWPDQYQQRGRASRHQHCAQGPGGADAADRRKLRRRRLDRGRQDHGAQVRNLRFRRAERGLCGPGRQRHRRSRQGRARRAAGCGLGRGPVGHDRSHGRRSAEEANASPAHAGRRRNGRHGLLVRSLNKRSDERRARCKPRPSPFSRRVARKSWVDSKPSTPTAGHRRYWEPYEQRQFILGRRLPRNSDWSVTPRAPPAERSDRACDWEHIMAAEQSKPKGPDFARGVPLDDLADGGMIGGHVGEDAVLLARRGDEVFAIGATCSHYGGPLAEGLMVGDTVRCPWHHACFSLRTGEAIAAPAFNPMSCWRVEKRNGTVFVRDKIEPAGKPKAQRPSAKPERMVIVGGGAAGFAAAEMLRREGFDGDLTLISSDDAAPYDRPNCSKDYLAGNAPEDWMPLRPAEFYKDQSITLELRTEV